MPVKRRRALLAKQPDPGIAGRSSSRTMGRARTFRRVLVLRRGADQREAVPHPRACMVLCRDPSDGVAGKAAAAGWAAPRPGSTGTCRGSGWLQFHLCAVPRALQHPAGQCRVCPFLCRISFPQTGSCNLVFLVGSPHADRRQVLMLLHGPVDGSVGITVIGWRHRLKAQTSPPPRLSSIPSRDVSRASTWSICILRA